MLGEGEAGGGDGGGVSTEIWVKLGLVLRGMSNVVKKCIVLLRDNSFASAMLSASTPNVCAIEEKVSPELTRYVSKYLMPELNC